ncbi:MAG TPA: hypothetical protein VHB79_04075 [Polyangiaceae bacterium]|nr:hypothetical protein [Polyangiaceae bacterium]
MRPDTIERSRPAEVSHVAVIAETEASTRDALSVVLRDAGYEMKMATEPEELATVLQARPLVESRSPLLVLSVGLARRCAGALAALAAQRAREGAAEINLMLTYEPGTLTAVVRPSLGPCNLVGMFEKPLDLDELRSLARTTKLVAEGAPPSPRSN